MAETYFAIIGDIVASRLETQRSAVQEKLKAVLERINNEFSDTIAANFLITLGDEFQGLIFNSSDADPIRIAVEIIDNMYPVRIRIAIGRGSMSTEIDRTQALGADGEAFHRARTGIETIRRSERNEKYVGSSILLCSEDERLDLAVNTLFGLSFAIRRGWTRRQSEIAARYCSAMLSSEHISQTKLAAELGTNQSSFSISLTGSLAREYMNGLMTVRTLLRPTELPSRRAAIQTEQPGHDAE